MTIISLDLDAVIVEEVEVEDAEVAEFKIGSDKKNEIIT